jgi:hypothetical protein
VQLVVSGDEKKPQRQRNKCRCRKLDLGQQRETTSPLCHNPHTSHPTHGWVKADRVKTKVKQPSGYRRNTVQLVVSGDEKKPQRPGNKCRCRKLDPGQQRETTSPLCHNPHTSHPTHRWVKADRVTAAQCVDRKQQKLGLVADCDSVVIYR